jgi:hypothetical protein
MLRVTPEVMAALAKSADAPLVNTQWHCVGWPASPRISSTSRVCPRGCSAVSWGGTHRRAEEYPNPWAVRSSAATHARPQGGLETVVMWFGCVIKHGAPQSTLSMHPGRGPLPALAVTAEQSLESVWAVSHRKREAKRNVMKAMAGRDAERALMIVLQSWLSTGVPRLEAALVGDGTARELVHLYHGEGTDPYVCVAYQSGLQPGLDLWVLKGYPDAFDIEVKGATGTDHVIAELRRAGFEAKKLDTVPETVVVRNGASTTAAHQEEAEREVLAEWRLFSLPHLVATASP